MEYIGENLWAGALGNTFVFLGFALALLATLFYAFGTDKPDQPSWRTIARTAFIGHAACMVGIVLLLLYMLGSHMFEYHYIWQHSNSEMPMRYIFSAFWEGQEGSTILWLFWQGVLGVILLFTAKKWEMPVMAVFASAQVFLLTMLLGVFVFDYRIGSNPFAVLLREHPDFAGLPFLANPNYLETLDGRGLNPLLQNYWMTIHPPTLFFGFASTLIPFAFAIAALWKRQFTAWFKPALPWTFLSIMVLGTGILMGGAWAYESLSFGGFWAWDPVENASLVPWLTLVGGGHLLLIQRNKGTSLLSTFFLILITYVLILYSTFLTKSGVLGETSVHAFTDLGLSGQLVFYFAFYGLLSIGLMIFRFKEMPKTKSEDALWSREFWMFVGALVLLLSAFQITFTTSIPVWNSLFGLEMAPPTDIEGHYNSFQLPVAVIIGFIIGFTQFLNYRRTNMKQWTSQILLHVIISLVLTVVIGLAVSMDEPLYLLMLFSSLFAVSCNVHYLKRLVTNKIPGAGSSLAHIGFGLVLLGALVSNGAQETISRNTSKYDLTVLDDGYENHENILLMLDDTLRMGDYLVTYTGKEKEGIYVRYNVEYLDTNRQSAFQLQPFVQLNNRMGNVAEPATRHFWNKDIFTYIKYAELEEREEADKQYKDPVEHVIRIGDTIYPSNAILILDSIIAITDPAEKASFNLGSEDLLVKAFIRAYDFDTKQHLLTPYFGAIGTRVVTFPDENASLGLKTELFRIDPNTGSMYFKLYESEYKTKEFIIMQAIMFPYINILWIGSILMALGIVVAIVSRVQRQRKANA